MKKIIFSLAITALLTACVTDAVSTGAQAAYDHHSIQTKLHDQYLYVQVDRAIHWNNGKKYENSHVSVSAFNGVVVLSGQVESVELRNQLENITKTVPGVDEIYNLTTVERPVSTLTAASDSWITTKIKSQLMAQIDIDPSQIKVITENSTVYLLGTVYPFQADIAVNLAKKTSGVGKVIKAFSYLHVTKSPRLNHTVA